MLHTKNAAVVLGAAVAVAGALYFLMNVSDAKLQLLVTVAAVGGGCYAIGLNQDSRYSQIQIQRLEAENRALHEKVRALKEMYLEDRATTRQIAAEAVREPLVDQNSITIRGNAIGDIFGRLLRRPTTTTVVQLPTNAEPANTEPAETPALHRAS